MARLIPKKKSTRGCVKKNDGLYTRQNRQTGEIFQVKLCNPVTEWTEAQQSHRSTFGALQSAICRWLRENKGTLPYRSLEKRFKRDGNYKTLRCYIMAKHYATLQSDGSVKMDI